MFISMQLTHKTVRIVLHSFTILLSIQFQILEFTVKCLSKNVRNCFQAFSCALE